MTTPISHLKVIELASVLAGPSVGMFFSELGAKVIKIENKKTGGDVTRTWKLPSEGVNEQSAYYSSVNWNKEILFLDLMNPEDFKILTGHLQDADILITNFKFGDDQKLNLTHQQLREINKDLIVGEINGFGTESDRVAYDLILQAESGFMSMNGNPESGPIKMPVALIDILAAHQLKEGLLVELLNDNKGTVVSVSLYDAAVSSLANQATNWLMANHIPKRIGSTHPNIAPYGELFVTKDEKSITFAIGSNSQFKALIEVLAISFDRMDLFESNKLRVKNRVDLSVLIQEAVSLKGSSELMNQLISKKVPVALIKNLKEVFNNPAAQCLILEENVAGQKTERVKTSIFKTTSL